MTLHLQVCGALLLGLAVAHAFFPRLFRWKEELARLSPLNRQIFLVHDFFIALVVAMMGAVSLAAPDALLDGGRLASYVLAGLATFWGARLVVQLFVYDAGLWRGRPFETIVHVLFAMLWIYFTSVYASALWAGLA